MSAEMATILFSFIDTPMIIIVTVLVGLGMFLKQSKISDSYIPLVLLVIGIVFSGAYSVFVLEMALTAGTIIVAVFQGILCASISVFGHQFVHQLIVKKPVDEINK